MMNRLAAAQSSFRGRRVVWIAVVAIGLVLAWAAKALSDGGGIFQIGTDVVRSDARINPQGYSISQHGNVYTVSRDGQPWVTLKREAKDIVVSDPTKSNIEVVAIRPGPSHIGPQRSTR